MYFIGVSRHKPAFHKPQRGMEGLCADVPVFFAHCAAGRADEAKLMLANNACLLYARDAGGCTPLHAAARAHCVGLTKHLLVIQAKVATNFTRLEYVDAHDSEGHTALSAAVHTIKDESACTPEAKGAVSDIIRCLEQSGASPSGRLTLMNTPDPMALCEKLPHLMELRGLMYPGMARPLCEQVLPCTEKGETGVPQGYTSLFETVGLGTAVTIEEIEGKVDLNDCQGVVISIDDERERYGVKITKLSDALSSSAKPSIKVGDRFALRVKNLSMPEMFYLRRNPQWREDTLMRHTPVVEVQAVDFRDYVDQRCRDVFWFVESYNATDKTYTVTSNGMQKQLRRDELLVPPVHRYVRWARMRYAWRDAALHALIHETFRAQFRVELDVGHLRRLELPWMLDAHKVRVFDSRDLSEEKPQSLSIGPLLVCDDGLDNAVSYAYMLHCMAASKLFAKTSAQDTFVGFCQLPRYRVKELLGAECEPFETCVIARFVEEQQPGSMYRIPRDSLSRLDVRFGRGKARFRPVNRSQRTLGVYPKHVTSKPFVVQHIKKIDRRIEEALDVWDLPYTHTVEAALQDCARRLADLRSHRADVVQASAKPGFSKSKLAELAAGSRTDVDLDEKYYAQCRLPQHMVQELLLQRIVPQPGHNDTEVSGALDVLYDCDPIGFLSYLTDEVDGLPHDGPLHDSDDDSDMDEDLDEDMDDDEFYGYDPMEAMFAEQNEMLSYGVKPWDDDYYDVLDVVRGRD
eukprot:TRINITY_DN11982_c0_g1_i3.p1 TRINITY_DN11982_c0_g1~~TRINITY_DN11982_c0_g1_i3.p1  ORF type:complete len:745 (+),score=222.30 TRINITY_DN11982_c0_g1_i3:3-2237(+)